MPRHSAQSQSLYGNVGGPAQPRPQFDLPGAIDALSTGATSVIHNVMARTAAQQAARHQKMLEDRQYEQILYQRKRDEANDAIAADDRAEKRAAAKRANEIEEIKLGITPRHTEQQYDAIPDGTATISALQPPSPVHRVMQQRMPGPQLTPSNTGVAGTMGGYSLDQSIAPAAQPTTVAINRLGPGQKQITIPASIDPENSLKAREEAAGRQRLHDAVVQSGASEAEASLIAERPELADEVLRLRAPGTIHTRADGVAVRENPKTGAFEPVMEAPSKPLRLRMPSDPESASQRTAERQRVASWRSHYAAAVDRLQRPRYNRDTMQDEPGLSAEEAKRRAQEEADDAFGPIDTHPSLAPRAPAASTGGMASFRLTGRGAQPASGADAAATSPATPAEDYTSDELADAFDAGKKTDKEIADFIAAKRKRPKAGTP